MAAPFKRICAQAAKQPCLRPHPRRRPDAAHHRTFTTTPVPHATSAADTQFLTTFPSSDADAPLDPTYEEDDLSSLAHAELDQHRELREMVRIAAWEMPLLSALSKPFEQPDRTKLPLRWRYTTYMGELHPAASKVVVEFKPADISDLSAPQRDKLLKLAGPRYNHLTGVLKMSCESHANQAQNKRHLGDIIAALLASARDSTADSFADMPLDTRHVKRKAAPRFPVAWLLTEERKRELDSHRRTALLAEGQRVEQNTMVSGAAAIESARQIDLRKVEEPAMVQARQPLVKGKQGKKEFAGRERGGGR
ncbi:hypothetical protein LTR08_002245 [Meristemomyces frigidus]|nr:hypothetical protein LTR08_002245 [Meristemomyces frigidus]